MKRLVVGASGMLGQELMATIAGAFGTCFRNSNDGKLIKLDLSDHEQAKSLIAAIKPDVIYLCAAMTNVDDCERNPSQSHRVNVWGAKGVADGAATCGAKVVYISSDYVFDGTKDGPYEDDDLPNPINEYGRQKMAAEHYILSRCEKPLIIRTSTLYGKGEQGFVSRVLRKLQSRDKVRVTGNIVTPTSAAKLASVIGHTLHRPDYWPSGIVNICGKESMRKVAYARDIATTWGFDDKLVEEVEPDASLAPRPLNCAMRCHSDHQSRMCFASGLSQLKDTWT